MLCLLGSVKFCPNQQEKHVQRTSRRGQEGILYSYQKYLCIHCYKVINNVFFSRTLTAVYDALLEDLVYPVEIVGKRIRIKLDGTQLIKVHLDKNEQTNIEHKVNIFLMYNEHFIFLYFSEHFNISNSIFICVTIECKIVIFTFYYFQFM